MSSEELPKNPFRQIKGQSIDSPFIRASAEQNVDVRQVGKLEHGELLDFIDMVLLKAELSARTRRLHAPSTAGQRQDWLERNFSRVEIVPSGKDYVVAMPDAYSLNYVHKPDPNFLQALFNEILGQKRRGVYIPQRFEVTSDSRDEGIGKLYNLISSNQWVYVYSPKSGQDRSALVHGRKYSVIKQNDPLHDHARTDLIDFISSIIEPYSKRVHIGSMEGMHSHLIDLKLV